jgi:hypothetical protein
MSSNCRHLKSIAQYRRSERWCRYMAAMRIRCPVQGGGIVRLDARPEDWLGRQRIAPGSPGRRGPGAPIVSAAVNLPAC